MMGGKLMWAGKATEKGVQWYGLKACLRVRDLNSLEEFYLGTLHFKRVVVDCQEVCCKLDWKQKEDQQLNSGWCWCY